MNSNVICFSIGLISDDEEIPAKRVEVSPDDRMEMIIFNNLGQFHEDFIVLCGDTEIWNSKEHGAASFDHSSYDGFELMVYKKDCKKHKVLLELKKAYKNATDKLAQFFVKTPMPHVKMKIGGMSITALLDTGAQLSIITKSGAGRCGILEKIDSRFQVDAQGITGLTRALGKILDVELEFSPGFYLPVVLTVFEECSFGSELIIGADVLIAYNAQIDFKNNCVRFNEEVEVEMIKECFSI